MLEIIRQAVALLILFPFLVIVFLLIPFVGKERAIEKIAGPVTGLAKFFVGLLLPKIRSADEFDLFIKKFRSKSLLWRPMYNFTWSTPDKDTLKLNITNCPFCQLLPRLGLSELAPHVCRGDWEYARVSSDKWDFDRKHQIGTGDSFCDHTYMRKKPVRSR